MKLGFNSTKVRLRRAAGRLSGKGRKFQFHKGSIKTRSLFPYVTLRKSFNSTKVRLRRSISYILLHYAICFNSTKVRLRLSGRNLRCVRKSFQFHKGSIKTGQNFGVLLFKIAFQFHKGSIKTAKGAKVQPRAP